MFARSALWCVVLCGTAGAWNHHDVVELIQWHNIYRCMHGLPHLKWNAKIAGNAQRWAVQTRGEMVHSSIAYRTRKAGFQNLGENLYKGFPESSVTGRAAVQAWYSEIKFSHGGRVDGFGNGQTGHYTQVVWRSTTSFGCGFNKGLVVCEYGPAGNMQGAYAQNVNAPTRTLQQCQSSQGMAMNLEASNSSDNVLPESVLVQTALDSMDSGASSSMKYQCLAVLVGAMMGGCVVLVFGLWIRRRGIKSEHLLGE